MGDIKEDPSNRSIQHYKKQLLEAKISSSGIQFSNSLIPSLKLKLLSVQQKINKQINKS